MDVTLMTIDDSKKLLEQVQGKYEQEKKRLETSLSFDPDYGPVKEEYDEILTRHDQVLKNNAFWKDSDDAFGKLAGIVDSSELAHFADWFLTDEQSSKKTLKRLQRLAKKNGIDVFSLDDTVEDQIAWCKTAIEDHLNLIYALRVTVPLDPYEKCMTQAKELLTDTLTPLVTSQSDVSCQKGHK